MNLSTPSKDNLAYMIEKIKEKLKMVNTNVLRPDDFSESDYQALYDIYEWIMKRDTFSPSEIQAIVSELGSLRK
ncbi:DUF1128 domain-containing protein [Ureibacillus sp. FSL K6-8385]|uniref:UPF0435 protein FKZ59_05985 n=1 Tax=Ureibacillus terrenus TaxID=118246 RepID=A0A540V368_9BACL|nr:DUF1128 domain-containing protein [Ureibacillus terrenus]MED3662728.1 DUF1128 domain-containing protein [Ureibacillus terrenus]MED3763675.1 DUF1128 domain-containing protein [Ureibacillus terrenus]TQE91194.1 DUF1128 domain-containing protein [Ureibacillus terrenus]